MGLTGRTCGLAALSIGLILGLRHSGASSELRSGAISPTQAPLSARDSSRLSRQGLPLIGYYGDWEGDLASVHFGQLSTLIYAFASPNASSCSLPNEAEDALHDFPLIRRMKRKLPHLLVLLSLGGGSGSGGFAEAAATKAKREELARNCRSLMHRKYPGVFDGVDIDWEGPTTRDQETEYTNLLRVFRRDLGPHGVLTAAVTPRFRVAWHHVAPILNWINLMTYDYHAPSFDDRTDFLAPLYADPRDPEFKAGFSVAGDVKLMVDRYGVSSHKIILGVPAYGYGYASVPDRNHGLFQPFDGNTRIGPLAPGVFDYRSIASVYAGRKGFREYGPSPISKEMWLYRAGKSGKGDFISYDGPRTVRAKAAFIWARHLGGAMLWTVGEDARKPSRSLTSALHRALAAPPISTA